MNKELKEQIKKIVKKVPLLQSEASEMIGVTDRTLRRFLNTDEEISILTMRKIQDFVKRYKKYLKG